MADKNEYTPPKVWIAKPALGRFANINKPTAGAQFERELPVGKHPLALYSLGTPNGVKVTIMLEELLAKGHGRRVRRLAGPIREGDQFGSGFVAMNPNSRSPRWSTGPGRRRSACSNPQRSSCISPRSSASFCRPRRRARRVPVIVVLADGQHALCRRRLWPLLRLRSD